MAEYLIDLNVTQAAIRAGYSPKTAAEIGVENLTKPQIAEAVQAAMQKRSERTGITQDMVLERWWSLDNADPRELIEYRRTCCRHCYGENSDYQLTQREIDKRLIDAQRTWELRKNKKPTDVFEEPDTLGGPGWDPRRPPKAQCPECFGEGVEKIFVRDTRELSPAAARLYAGVKQTKDGIQIMMRSQDDALLNVAKHLGMHVHKHELTGKDGKPVEVEVDVVDLRNRIASRIAGLGSRIVATADLAGAVSSRVEEDSV